MVVIRILRPEGGRFNVVGTVDRRGKTAMKDEAAPPVREPMTSDRMRWALDHIGWGQRELARRLAVNESRVRKMARGINEIPPELAAWLETLAKVHAAFPMPTGWRALQDVED